ncbi:11748_t:CDS:2, partial [Acaulospora colombiana]
MNDQTYDGESESNPAEKLRAKQEKRNMRKAQKKAAKNSGGSSTEISPASAAAKQAELQEKVRMLVNQLAIREAIQPSINSNSQKVKDMSSHKFWSTQPVPKHGEIIEEDGPIEENTPYDQIRKEPYTLPKEFEWSTLELNNENELNELYTLLTNNYVEDDDAMFRFDYSGEFLKWALQPPGYKKIWHVGVRVSATKRLVAFVSGIPADIRIYESKRLAPVLIKEVTRRSHLEGIFQAVYTAGVVLPKPISKARYYHRSLNPKKLIDTKFSALPSNTPMSRHIKKYKLPSETSTPGIRPMLEKDVSQVRELLNAYMEKFNFVAVFKTDEDIKHWILTKENVVWSYVVEVNPETKKITDFVSFYYLPSSVIGNPIHKTVNAVYLFYYAVQESEEKAIKSRLQSLMKDALILAKSKNMDVFNCLDILENKFFIEDLRFGPGDGYLNYYMYNWRCREMGSENV